MTKEPISSPESQIGWMRFLPDSIQTRFGSYPNLQKILGNTGWLFADRFVRLGLGLFVGIWMANYLGPTQYGIYNYALAFVTIFLPLANLGLDSIVIRDLVQDEENKYLTLGTTFALKLLSGIFTILLIITTISLLRPDELIIHQMVGIISLGILMQSFDAIDFWFQSQVQSKYTIYAKDTAYFLVTAARIVLLIVGAPIIAFAFTIFVEFSLSALGLIIVYKRNGQQIINWKANIRRAKELLRVSWPLILSGLAIMIYMKIDQIMLGLMIDDQAVGIYAAATRISELWYFIPTIIVSSLFPSIIEARKTNKAIYYSRLQKLFDIMSSIALVVAITMTFSSSYIINILYQDDYIASAPILSIHIWAAIFVFMGVAQNPWDVAEEYTKLTLKRTLLGASVNIALNILLIPLYSGLGAAISTVISQAVSAWLGNLIDSRTRIIFTMQLKSIFVFRYFIKS